MILRRITQHVRDQNWTAIAIDFVIVVTGVFLGIQLGNWNDERADQQRETRILDNIATDLRSDIADYSESIDASVTKIAAIEHILENTSAPSGHMLTDDVEIDGMVFSDFYKQYLDSGSLNLEQRVESVRNKLWWHTVLVPNVAPSTTAFDSLVSNGDLGVIRNEELVGRLQSYRQLTTAIFKAQEVTFRPQRDNAIDIGLELGLSPFRTTDERLFLELVTNDPKLAATIHTQMGWTQGHLTMVAGANNRAKLMLAQIEDELGFETRKSEPSE